MKTYRLVWSISLLTIACITIISSLCNIFGISLPDTIRRIFGILDLCGIIAIVFTSVKLQIWKKDN